MAQEIILQKNERLDDLQYNGLKLIQDTESFCFGCDAVELANFMPSVTNKTACDLGAGNGIISVLLAAKKGYAVTAVEIQSAAAALCEKNAAINGLESKITVENLPMQLMKEKYPKGSFDAVVSNPPYLKLKSGQTAATGSKAIARHEVAVTISEVIETAAHLTKFGGKFYLVYPAQRLSEVLQLCSKAKLEPKILQILSPNVSKPPHLFLLSCTHGGKTGLTVLPERVIDAYNV